MPGSGKGVMLWRMTLSGKVRPLLVAVALVVSLAPLQAQDTAAKALVNQRQRFRVARWQPVGLV